MRQVVEEKREGMRVFGIPIREERQRRSQDGKRSVLSSSSPPWAFCTSCQGKPSCAFLITVSACGLLILIYLPSHPTSSLVLPLFSAIIIKLISKVIEHPSEAKFRSIRTSSQSFRDKVGRLFGAEQLMLAAGFTRIDQDIMNLLQDDMGTRVPL